MPAERQGLAASIALPEITAKSTLARPPSTDEETARGYLTGEKLQAIMGMLVDHPDHKRAPTLFVSEVDDRLVWE
jgi:hypothetical protein